MILSIASACPIAQQGAYVICNQWVAPPGSVLRQSCISPRQFILGNESDGQLSLTADSKM